MGVKGCFRNDCNNIMCDTYIESIGYVCSDCKREFKDYLEENNLEPKNEYEIKKELKKFMETLKDNSCKDDISVDDFFSNHTR